MGMDGMDQEDEGCCGILLVLVLCPPLGIVLVVGYVAWDLLSALAEPVIELAREFWRDVVRGKDGGRDE